MSTAMSTDDGDMFDLGPFESHAELYLELGWHPFPLPYRKKKQPPVGVTGDAGTDADAEQVAEWMRTKRGGNIGLHADALTVGIDVDDYDGKNGGATLADLEAKLGPLPPTWITTSRRDDDVSGIRHFRIPQARRLITKLDGIEIVQRHHRYVCAPPSIHPDTGNPYGWTGPDGTWSMDPPYVDDLPMLPDAWFEFLTDNEGARSETRTEAKRVARGPGAIDGGRSRAVDDAVRYAITDLGNGCRHDAMIAGALALARLEERGHPGTDNAIDELANAFITAIGGDRKHADKEFKDAIKSARNKARTTAAKTPHWDDLQHGPVDPDDLGFGTFSKNAPPANVDPETGEKIGSPNLPDEFYAARPVLEQIRAHAHHRARSADVLFGAILARVCALTPTTYHLPAVVGSRGSLNVMMAFIGPSGTGKSTTRDLGAELLPFNDDRLVDDFPVGTGEGLVDAYFEMVDDETNGKKAKVKRKTKTSVLAVIDEGQSSIETGKRSGSILWSTMRTAWSGGVLGQGNAGTETKRIIAKGNYRCAVVANFQTAYAVEILADAPGGTPQRIIWLSAVDPSIPTSRPPEPEPFHWSPPAVRESHGIGFDCDIEVAPTVATEIWDDSVAVARGTVQLAELDSHRNLVRLKVAALLGLLDGRPSVSVDDWALAGIVMTTSDAVRANIEAHARWKAQRGERATRAKLVGRAAAADIDASERALVSMAKSIGRHVHKGACKDGCKRRCASRAVAGKHKQHASVDEAIDEAVRRGWIVVNGDAFTPGEETP